MSAVAALNSHNIDEAESPISQPMIIAMSGATSQEGIGYRGGKKWASPAEK